MDSKKLFHFSETSPTAFAETRHLRLNYSLTLVLHRDKTAWLYLSSPGFRPSLPCKTEEIETVSQIFFPIFFSSCFMQRIFRI